MKSIPGAQSAKVQTFLLRAVCAFVLVCILAAGLWPFHAPRNEVSWLTHGNGLQFDKYGSIVSAGSFEANPSQADSSCSLEIWLEPRRGERSGTILAFYWPEGGIVRFLLRQYQGGLVLERTSEDRLHHAEQASIYVDQVFSHPKAVLITITSAHTGTTVYADGALVKQFADFGLSSQELTGQLVLGNSPVTTHDWSGQVQGLAVYHRELTAGEVSQHLADWTKRELPDDARREGAVGLYLFNEGNGKVVHNQVDAATDLLIPERFFVLHQPFLELPWEELRSDLHYWNNVGINIVGFIPLGFFFFAYFSWVRKSQRAVGNTIALGFVISLTIEVLQAFLPTRDSGVTDLITNTFGTALGTRLCVWSMKLNWFTPPAISSRSADMEEKRFSSSSS